jgi:methionine-rich copper-binding protein CopC
MWQKILRNIVLLLILSVPAGIPKAAAHAIIVQSIPVRDAVMAGPVIEVSLSYNVRIDATRSRLSLTDPSGAETRIAIAAGGAPERLTATLTDLAAGSYILHWQVLASDGHITRGDIPFTVAP